MCCLGRHILMKLYSRLGREEREEVEGTLTAHLGGGVLFWVLPRQVLPGGNDEDGPIVEKLQNVSLI